MAEQTYGEWIRSNPPMPTKNLNTKHMAQQTAVEWFIDNAFEEGFLWVTDKPAMFELNLIIEKAKEMEEKRTIEFAEQYNSYLIRCSRGIRGSVVEMDAEQYYKEVFKK